MNILYEHFERAGQQYKTINAFGIGRQSSNIKQYAFGLFPMADAFIAWGRSSALHAAQSKVQSAGYWGLKFHVISMLSIIFAWGLFYAKPIVKKLSNRIGNHAK